MGKKRINSKIYHISKILYDKDNGFYYYKNPDGYLFSNFIYQTKIKPEDLPDWYIFGRYYKGYLCLIIL